MPELLKDMEAFYEVNAERMGDRATQTPHGTVRTALNQLAFLEKELGESNYALIEEKS